MQSTEETYQLLVSPGDPSFDSFYRIYAESIEPREQKPRALISRMVGRPDYKVLLQRREGVVIGFGILFAPETETFSLLEYMAVDGAHRGSGLGRELFLRVEQLSASTKDEALPVLLEVDSDREASADQDLRRKRLHFYRELGCLRIEGLSYMLPLRLKIPLPEMDLMVRLPLNYPTIRKPELRHWLAVIYRDVYNCSPDDPRIDLMLEEVCDPVRLG
jgi:GNAT superfamily N-acetyltransferase